jgi:methyltransferase (TIGR00027 family)
MAHICGFGPDDLASSFLDPAAFAPDAERVKEMRTKFDADGSLPSIPGAKGASAARYDMIQQQKAMPWRWMDTVSFMQCRTCLGDDAVMQWAEEHASGCNIVILGSGYDTKYYRLSLPASASFFEVDAPATQEQKLKMMEAADTPFPNKDSVHFVPCDFMKENWFERLVTDGLQKNLPTMIVAEGLFYYLDRDVVVEILRTVAEDFSGPAAMFFDYVGPEFLEMNREAMKAMGEPWLCSFAAAEISDVLRERGLKELDHLSLEDCVERYVPVTKSGEPLGVGTPHKFFIIAANSKC